MKVEKASFRLALCVCATYTMYVMGKMSFSAATVGLIDAGVLTKSQAGTISGMFWFVYAMGQILGAFIGNKICPYLLIEIAVAGSAISNLLMACTENFTFMLVVWCAGAVSQFGLWPAVLKLSAEEVGEKHKSAASGFLAYSYTIASILNYFLTAWLLATFSWRHIFIVCGMICGIGFPAMLYAKKKLAPLLKQEKMQGETISTRKRGKLTKQIVWERGLIFFALMMCMQSIIETGIGNWMPTILLELYGVSSSQSSLLSVVRLGINFMGIALGIFVYHKMHSDELKALIFLRIPLILVLLLLMNMRSYNVYVTVLLLFTCTILLGATGARLSLNYPARYQDVGLTATIGSIINCMSTGGMAIATYGGGYLADSFGWDSVIYMWNILAILFVVIAIAIIPLWKRFQKGWGLKRH